MDIFYYTLYKIFLWQKSKAPVKIQYFNRRLTAFSLLSETILPL